MRPSPRPLEITITSLASSTQASPSHRGLAAYLRELWDRREFAWYLATSNLRARNATTALGIVWWVLNPMLLTGVYFLVFGIIFSQGRRGNPEYLAYLMSGMFAYRFTSSVITRASSTIVNNSKLIVNLRFPRLVLPLSSVIESGIGFLVSILAFFAISLPSTGFWPGWKLFYFAPVFLLHIMFSLGLGSLAARLAVPFRDVSNLIPYLLRIWLYLSPIIWTVDLLDDVPAWVTPAMNLNPMYHILLAYRTALLGWELNLVHLAGSAVSGVFFLIVGTLLFRRFEGKLVNYL